MTDQNTENATPTEEEAPKRVDSLSFDSNVIEKIVAYACNEVKGIASMKGNILNRVQEGLGGKSDSKGVNATIGTDKTVALELAVIIEYGSSAVDVYDNIREVISKHIAEMTDLTISSIDVRIVDVELPGEEESEQAE